MPWTNYVVSNKLKTILQTIPYDSIYLFSDSYFCTIPLKCQWTQSFWCMIAFVWRMEVTSKWWGWTRISCLNIIYEGEKQIKKKHTVAIHDHFNSILHVNSKEYSPRSHSYRPMCRLEPIPPHPYEPPHCIWCNWLTHFPLNKIAVISQTIFSDEFSWMKSFAFWLEYHWSLFIRVRLTITQYLFIYWLGAE